MLTNLTVNYRWRRLITNAMLEYYEHNSDSLSLDNEDLFDDLLFDLYSNDFLEQIKATNPLAVWFGSESTTQMRDYSGNERHGTHVWASPAAILGNFGSYAPSYDGVNDYTNLYSASLAGAFNLNEFTVVMWFKAGAASIWTDGVRHGLARFQADGTNRIFARKETTNNRIRFTRDAGGSGNNIDIDTFSGTDWQSIAFTASYAGGGLLNAREFAVYKGKTRVGLNTLIPLCSVSGLSTTLTLIGADTNASAFWLGALAPVVVYNRPIDSAILALL